MPWTGRGPDGAAELGIEAFSVFDHASFGTPSLHAFTGSRAGGDPLPRRKPNDGHLVLQWRVPEIRERLRRAGK